jgi:imidazolonepropionase-like amidohydrolase
MTPQLYRPIIDEAHKNNLRVVAHIFNLDDAKELLRSGVDGFAHGVRDRDVDDEFMTLIKSRPDVFVMPNLPERGVDEELGWISGTVRSEAIARMRTAAMKRTEEERQKVREFFGIQARNLARINAAGVRIGFGEDGNGAGWTAHVELADMVAAGMTPAQAIVAATRTSAEILRLGEQLGTLAAGKSADFVVLDADPLVDIMNTRRIARVYLRGQEVERTALSAAWTRGATE